MKSELEVQRELHSIRALLKPARDRGEYHAMLYGAQQALGWVLDQLQSPTELEKTIREVAKELDDADQQGGA
jgi:hypothetical protein